jgi:hypothetical protein
MFKGIKTAYDRLDPEKQKIIQDNLADPEFLDKIVTDAFRPMTEGAKKILTGMLRKMQEGLVAIKEMELKSPKKWAEGVQEDSDEKEWERIQDPDGIKGILELFKNKISGMISKEDIEHPDIKTMRENITARLERALIALNKTTNIELPDSLEDLRSNSALLRLLSEEQHYTFPYSREGDIKLNEHVDVMLTALGANIKEEEEL